jgi:hypothetical protein
LNPYLKIILKKARQVNEASSRAKNLNYYLIKPIGVYKIKRINDENNRYHIVMEYD